MSKTSQLSIAAISLAAAVAACGRGKGVAQQDDFKSDLQLAASTTMDLATPKVDPSLLNSSLENKPQGAPQPATTIKKASSGNRAVRSHTPTVRAAPETQVASTDESAQEAVTVQQVPAPDISEPAAVAPRPSPAPTADAGNGSGDYGTSGNGGGIFGPGGGMGGVVIRGGGADGDHCEPHGGMGRRGGMGGPILIPRTTVPVIGGIPAGTGSRAGGGMSAPRSGGGSVSRPGTGGSRRRG